MQVTGRIHGRLEKVLLPKGAPRPLTIINYRKYVWITKQKDTIKCRATFGLRSSIAHKAKVRCARTFDDFQLQAVCMQNEKDGYDKMQSY